MIYIDAKPIPDQGSCRGSCHPRAASRHHGTLRLDRTMHKGSNDLNYKPTQTIPVRQLHRFSVANIEQHGSVESQLIFLVNHKYSRIFSV